VVALIFKLYAITAEIGDPADFGGEIPVLITLILALLNRFLWDSRSSYLRFCSVPTFFP